MQQDGNPSLLAQATPSLLTDTEAVRLAELFKAFSDPTRVHIIIALT